MVGLSQVHSGQILVGGEPAADLGHKKLAQMVSYLPSRTGIFRRSRHGRWCCTEGFPTFPIQDIIRKTITGWYRKLWSSWEIWDLRKEEIARLSGGERQKVYLAMALAGDTSTLILDEPTTYLDICYQLEFLKLLKKLKEEGKTIAVILHDLNAALQHADQMIVMDHGKAAAMGKPEEIFESRVLERVFRVRSHSFLQEDGERYYYFD